MTDSRALDMDRLPWLADEREARPKRKIGWAIILPWALLAALLIAGMSYWLGMQSAAEPELGASNTSAGSAATATLPEPTFDPLPIERDAPLPMRDVRPAAEPAPVRIASAEPKHKVDTSSLHRPAQSPERDTSKQAAPAKEGAAKAAPKLDYWPAFESTGASGRMVRIGTFSSRRQAKKGWWAIVRHYPGMRRLNAVVAPVPSLRNGRTFYRLQFGTTSQAHSEILCQRMRMIALSCVVVDLQGARGGDAK